MLLHVLHKAHNMFHDVPSQMLFMLQNICNCFFGQINLVLVLQILCMLFTDAFPFFWQIHIISDIKDFEFQLYVGDNTSHVRGKYEESQSLFWVFWTTPWQSNVVAVPQFNETCLGVYTKQPYHVILKVKGECWYLTNIWKPSFDHLVSCGFCFNLEKGKLVTTAHEFHETCHSVTFIVRVGRFKSAWFKSLILITIKITWFL